MYQGREQSALRATSGTERQTLKVKLLAAQVLCKQLARQVLFNTLNPVPMCNQASQHVNSAGICMFFAAASSLEAFIEDFATCGCKLLHFVNYSWSVPNRLDFWTAGATIVTRHISALRLELGSAFAYSRTLWRCLEPRKSDFVVKRPDSRRSSSAALGPGLGPDRHGRDRERSARGLQPLRHDVFRKAFRLLSKCYQDFFCRGGPKALRRRTAACNITGSEKTKLRLRRLRIIPA